MRYDETYLSTRKFADLVGTSRATLVHYDDLGLLKPAFVKENGYRYYQPAQAQTFLVISLFSECGVPLKTIGEHINAFDARNGRALVDLAISNAEAHIRRLTQIRNYMLNKRFFYEIGIEHDADRPFIARFPAMRYLISSARSISDGTQIQTDHAICISRYMASHGEFPDHPYMARLEVEYLDGGKFAWSSMKEPDLELQFGDRGEGLYCCYFLEGDISSAAEITEVLAQMFSYAREKGFDPVGKVFLIDMANFVITRRRNEYATLFQVLVQPAQKPSKGPPATATQKSAHRRNRRDPASHAPRANRTHPQPSGADA